MKQESSKDIAVLKEFYNGLKEQYFNVKEYIEESGDESVYRTYSLIKNIIPLSLGIIESADSLEDKIDNIDYVLDFLVEAESNIVKYKSIMKHSEHFKIY